MPDKDPDWQRRDDMLRGRTSKPSEAEVQDDGGSFTGDGPSGESLSGENTEPDAKQEDDKPAED